MIDVVFERATLNDIQSIIEVRNKSFYEDFIKYGECPGYNSSIESLKKSIQEKIVYNIFHDKRLVGNISVSEKENGEYFLHCLCVIPEYENKGIGQKAMTFIDNQFSKAKHWSLETPADKKRNHYFYKKHGYTITKEYMDGSVKIVLFEKCCDPAV